MTNTSQHNTTGVFDEVQSGATTYGVVPFENSTHGTVSFTLDALADRTECYGDVSVCGEVYLDVHHFLLGRLPPSSPPSSTSSSQTAPPQSSLQQPKATPLTSLSHIRRVYSHPQAFGQTGAFFRKHLAGIECIEVSSTSRAAELAASDATGTSAAVAGEITASAFGLDVLARCIEDRDDNTTRFFVLRKGDATAALPSIGTPRQQQQQQQQQEAQSKGKDPYGKDYKTLVSFTVSHSTPGALADVLGCFKRHALNLTSINSLPSLIAPFQYLFFVEFEASRFDDPEGRVRRLREDVKEAGDDVVQRWRWLGSWRNQRG